MANKKPLLGTTSVDDKLDGLQNQENGSEVDPIDQATSTNSNPEPSIEKKEPSPALQRFNIQSKQYKRIGVDIWDKIDNDVEKITGDILKDKISKKDLINEAMEIGFPLWLKKHGMTDLLEKYKK